MRVTAKATVSTVALCLLVACGGASKSVTSTKASASPALSQLAKYRAAETQYGTRSSGATDDEVKSVAANSCDNTAPQNTQVVAALGVTYTDVTALQSAIVDKALLLNAYCPEQRIFFDAAVNQDVRASGITLPPEADGSVAPAPVPVVTTPPAPVTYTAGQSVAVTLTSTNRLDGTTTDGAATITARSFNTTTYSTFGVAPQNGLYVIVSVNYKATSGSIDYNPYNWELQLPDGTTYKPFTGNSYAAAADPHLDSGALSQGQQTTGNLVFDANAPHGQLLYKPGTNIVATWNF
jgi:hypothetical protein